MFSGKFVSRIGGGKLLGPKGIAVNSAGNLIVVDNKASCVYVFQLNGKLLSKFGSRGSEAHNLAGPHYVAVNSQGHIIISDFHNHSIKVCNCINFNLKVCKLTGLTHQVSYYILLTLIWELHHVHVMPILPDLQLPKQDRADTGTT